MFEDIRFRGLSSFSFKQKILGKKIQGFDGGLGYAKFFCDCCTSSEPLVNDQRTFFADLPFKRGRPIFKTGHLFQ